MLHLAIEADVPADFSSSIRAVKELKERAVDSVAAKRQGRFRHLFGPDLSLAKIIRSLIRLVRELDQ